jgi:hypothetical protein
VTLEKLASKKTNSNTKKTATLGVAASIYILKNKLGIGKLATCVGRAAKSHSFGL